MQDFENRKINRHLFVLEIIAKLIQGSTPSLYAGESNGCKPFGGGSRKLML
jgi:hypothetical protein